MSYITLSEDKIAAGSKVMGTIKVWVTKIWSKLTSDRQRALTEESVYTDIITRPAQKISSDIRGSWENENVLVLGQTDELFELAKDMSSHGASISFRSLVSLQDLYHLPLEQYSIVLMTSGTTNQQFDVIDVGGILRRSNPELVLVWASSQFKMSMVADSVTDRFCDFQLALPASPAHLEVLLHHLAASEG